MRILNERTLRKQVGEAIRSDIENGKVGGASVVVTQNGEVLYKECFSNNRLGIHVNEKTVFRLASMSKPITAAAVFKLIDRGMLSLDTPVSRYIPQLEQMYVGWIDQGKPKRIKPAQTPITIRHLLTHSGGLGSGRIGEYIEAAYPPRECKSLEQMIKIYAEQPLDFEPGTSQLYSGICAFDTLSRVVEIISDMPYDQFLKTEILDPLGMVDTTFAPTKEQWLRMIPMHTYENGISKIADYFTDSVIMGFPTTYFCGAGGLASTIDDYEKFADMLLHYGRAGALRLISEKMIRQMATAQLSPQLMKGQEIWGLGVRVIVDKDYVDLPVGAFGWSGAYGTHFWVDPVNQVTAVYMKNSLYDGGSGALTARQFERNVNAAFEDIRV